MKVFAKNGNYIGELKGKTLYKTIRKSEHWFRNAGPNGGIGIDYDALLTKLPSDGDIKTWESEEEVGYVTTVAKWREKGTTYHFKDERKNHYPQIFLAKEEFEIVSKKK